MQSESQICKDFVSQLEALSQYNKLHYKGQSVVWFHVPNEFKIYDARYGARKKREGVKPGVADYVFLWKGGSGFIEIKTEKGYLSPSQKDFQSLCKKADIPYEIVRSSQEALSILEKWGIIIF